MALVLCVLGSGSLGNSTLVGVDDGARRRHLLIDAGLSPRQTARRLAPLGLDLAAIEGLLLTHLDTDHFHRGWSRIIDRNDLPVHVHGRHRHAAVRRGVPVRCLHAFESAFAPCEGMLAHGVLMAHDQLGTVGYRLEHDGCRLGFATDLGRVSAPVLRHLDGIDAIALESNYDRRMQLESPRPEFVRRRVMGGAGHLSNEQAIEAVLRIDRGRRLQKVVLLHLSRECNDPAVVRRLYRERAPHLAERLTISDQHRPTPVLEIGPRSSCEQLTLL